jgi:hypothetical protein
MLALGLALTLTAAPTAADAQRLAQTQGWEALYLAWATVEPRGYSKKDALAIGRALAQGCAAVLGDDAVMAFGLGEKAAAFEPSAEALYCLGLAARRAEQRAAAESAFRAGAGRFPRDGRFPLELGRLLADEGDTAGALAALARVRGGARESSEARALAARVRGEVAPGERAGARRAEGSPRTAPPGAATGLSYESSVDGEGRRVRQNAYFRFLYFNAQRDFGQRAEYEGTVQAALEQARAAATRLLGAARERPVDVVLYSREEFQLHHGPRAALMVAGFYSESAIRMNDSAEMTARVQATLVHEYVHAVMDELLGFNHAALPTWMHEGVAEYVEWRFQGQDQPPRAQAKALEGLARQGALPSLGALSQGPLIGTRDPALAYAQAACAVRWMVQAAGMPAVLAVIRDAGQGTPFAEAFERHLDRPLEALDRALRDDLATQ